MNKQAKELFSPNPFVKEGHALGLLRKNVQ